MSISLATASAVAVDIVEALDDGTKGVGDGVDFKRSFFASMVTPNVTGTFSFGWAIVYVGRSEMWHSSGVAGQITRRTLFSNGGP